MKEHEISIQFRMKESTHEKLKLVAKSELRSLNSQIEYFVLKGIKEYENRNKETEPDKGPETN